jgi:RNase P subunit RPR2
MCTPEYDLVCDKCREKFDRIFSVEVKSEEQERKLLTKWIRSLCKNCRKLLIEEGYISGRRVKKRK